MTSLKKSLSFIVCIVLITAMALVTIGCNDKTETPGTSSVTADVSSVESVADVTPYGTVTVTDGATIGEGDTQFNLVITDGEGKATNVVVKTDKTTVGDALLELKVIGGDNDDYGLYVKEVNGVVADYDVDQTYWAFYINGEYAMTGVDATDIVAGDNYALKVEG